MRLAETWGWQVGLSTARVVGLYVALEAGAAIESRAAVQLAAGAGVVGDRYATGQGHWSDPRWPDQELTLVEAELADELGLAPDLLRRNVVTRGLALDELIGRVFSIGDALLEGVRSCDPCRYLEGMTRPGLLRELAGRGGLRAKVLRGGTVRVGDAVVAISLDDLARDREKATRAWSDVTNPRGQ